MRLVQLKPLIELCQASCTAMNKPHGKGSLDAQVKRRAQAAEQATECARASNVPGPFHHQQHNRNQSWINEPEIVIRGIWKIEAVSKKGQEREEHRNK